MTTLHSSSSLHNRVYFIDVFQCNLGSVPSLSVFLVLYTMDINDMDLIVNLGLRINQL